ncbi:mCG145430, partial [Mus musculus]
FQSFPGHRLPAPNTSWDSKATVLPPWVFESPCRQHVLLMRARDCNHEWSWIPILPCVSCVSPTTTTQNVSVLLLSSVR